MRRNVFLMILYLGLWMNGNSQTFQLLDSCPTSFSYQVVFDSIPQIHTYEKIPVTFSHDSIEIGCSGFKIMPEFTVMINHDWLFRSGNEIVNFMDKSTNQNLPIVLYAIKRFHSTLDTAFMAAIDYYCYYGQHNEYYLTKDYILFTYTKGSSYQINALKSIGLENKVIGQLISNLNNGAKVIAKVQPSTNNTEYVQSKLRGKFEQINAKPGWKLDEKTIISDTLKYEISDKIIMKFKPLGRFKRFMKMEYPVGAIDKDAGKWRTDGQYVYLYLFGFTPAVFEFVAPNVLVNVDGLNGYQKSE